MLQVQNQQKQQQQKTFEWKQTCERLPKNDANRFDNTVVGLFKNNAGRKGDELWFEAKTLLSASLCALTSNRKTNGAVKWNV